MKSFPPFRLDQTNQCLWREEERILLPPKVFSVLQYLVDHAGRLVSQEEILEGLWRDIYVQPEVLRKYILEIRRALADPPKEPRFIATYPKRGYRFIAPVAELNPHANSLAGRQPPVALAPDNVVGRSRILEQLHGYLEAGLRGNRQIVFLTGEPGIGKTTLADAFQFECQSRSGLSVARGQCMEGFGGKEAYYPVLDAVGQWMSGPHSEAVVETLARLAPTWLVQFPGAVKPERREALQREILGATRERMVREFCEAIESLTALHPLVLILEDLHWVDSSTLDLISALGRRRGAARLMLVATYRPVEVILSGSPLKSLKQDLLVHRLCREIALERLTEGEVEEFLSAKFRGSGLPKLLGALIHRRSDGNPLFMVALVEQLVEKGLIREDRGRWLAAGRMDRLDSDVPETLGQMLEAQIEHLDALEQSVLRAASVAGRRFSAWAVSAALADDPGRVEAVCEGLALRQQLLRRCGVQELPGGSASAQYEFRHILYREALDAQLPAGQRRQFHLHIASRMEGLLSESDSSLAAELASHFEAGHDYRRAIHYLILTAGNAARRYAHTESVQLLRQALELLPRIAPDARAPLEIKVLEIQILERISDALYAQGEMEQSGDVDQRAAELSAQAGLKAAQVNALTRLARVLAFRDPERCISLCERALEVSRTHDDPLLEARAEMLAACWRIVTNGWNAPDARVCESARERIRGLSNEVPAYYEILYAHVESVLGRHADACRTAQAGISSSLENDNLVVYLSAHSSLAQALLHLGQWGEELRVIAAAQNAVEKNGNAPWRGIFQGLLAWLKLQACDFQGAASLAETLLASHTEEPAGQVRTMAMVTSGFAALATGEPDRAAGIFSKVCGRQLRPRFFMDWYWRMFARLGLSHALLEQGRDREAAAEASALVEAAQTNADPAFKAVAWRLAACIAIHRRDWDAAWNALNQAFSILHVHPAPAVAWRLHATAFDLHCRAGDAEAAAHHRARAAAILMDLVRSIPPEEPLHGVLLGSPTVQAILSGANTAAVQ
jgi:DNA-binding winged helix-turn-helix (wHTH) protein/tetratricopeptide (TPR) repeat protein